MASTRTAYILWLIFGWTGLHHVYLRRYIHGFVWFATLGGVCGIGWIRDYWRIPDYISWCSPDKSQKKKFMSRSHSKTIAGCSKVRQSGMTIMALLMSYAFSSLIPEITSLCDKDSIKYSVLFCAKEALKILGNALGVYLVANIGEIKCTPYYPFVTSLCALPLMFIGGVPEYFAGSITAYVTKTKGLQWRTLVAETEKRSKTRHCILFTCYIVACVVWVVVLIYGVYSNAAITVDKEKVLVREYVESLFGSEQWQELKQNLTVIYNMGMTDGPGRIWDELTGHIDITGKIKAYWILGVLPGISENTIAKKCRKQLAEYHPDRFRSSEEKGKAKETFNQIRQACHKLSPSRQQKPREE